jgi:flagellar FliL protein
MQSKGVLILISVIIVILLTVIGVGGYFFLNSDMMNNQEEVDEAITNNEVIYKASINDMVLNVTNSKGREKLMKLSFTIKSSEPMIEQVVGENTEVIMDQVILLISARSTEELLTVGGKALLKEELREEINSTLNEITQSNEDLQKDMVNKILYTSFVIK